MNYKKIVPVILRLVAAIILLQTLYFKLTAQPESVQLFSKLKVEPWGRIGTGIVELITSILLLVPASVLYRALMGIGLMCGAILSHLFVIGISSDGDGGELFILALVVLSSCFVILWFKRIELIALLDKLYRSSHRKA